MKLIVNSTSIGLIALSTLVAIGCGRNSGNNDPRYNDPYYQQGGGGYGGGGYGGVSGGQTVVTGGGGQGGGYGGGPQGPGGGYPGGGQQGRLCDVQQLDTYFNTCNITVEERRVRMKQGFYRSAGTSGGVYPNIFSDQKFLTHFKVTRAETQCLQSQMCGGGPGGLEGPQRGYPQQQGGGYPPRGQGPGQGPGPGRDEYQPYEPDQADYPESQIEAEQEEPQQRASRPRRSR